MDSGSMTLIPIAVVNPQVAMAVAATGMRAPAQPGNAVGLDETASRIAMFADQENDYEQNERENVPTTETGANVDMRA